MFGSALDSNLGTKCHVNEIRNAPYYQFLAKYPRTDT